MTSFCIHPSAFCISSSPARLLQSRDLSRQGQLAEHDARDLELAQEALAAAGQLAAVVRARRTRITREVAQGGVVLVLLELPTNIRVALHQRRTTFLLCYPG